MQHTQLEQSFDYTDLRVLTLSDISGQAGRTLAKFAGPLMTHKIADRKGFFVRSVTWLQTYQNTARHAPGIYDLHRFSWRGESYQISVHQDLTVCIFAQNEDESVAAMIPACFKISDNVSLDIPLEDEVLCVDLQVGFRSCLVVDAINPPFTAGISILRRLEEPYVPIDLELRKAFKKALIKDAKSLMRQAEKLSVQDASATPHWGDVLGNKIIAKRIIEPALKRVSDLIQIKAPELAEFEIGVSSRTLLPNGEISPLESYYRVPGEPNPPYADVITPVLERLDDWLNSERSAIDSHDCTIQKDGRPEKIAKVYRTMAAPEVTPHEHMEIYREVQALGIKL